MATLINAETKSQKEQILEYLLAGGQVTQLEALHKFKTMRLASRISDIKAMGYDVKKESVKVAKGKFVACYFIEKKEAVVAV